MGICFRFMNKSIVKILDIFKQHKKKPNGCSPSHDALVTTGANSSPFCLLCRLLFFFSPSSLFFGGVGTPFFFFFRQLKGLGLLCFLFLFRPRLSPSFWPMPCSSFRLRMLSFWAELTSSPSWTAWTWSRDVWWGLSNTMVLRIMYSRGTPGIFFRPAVTFESWRARIHQFMNHYNLNSIYMNKWSQNTFCEGWHYFASPKLGCIYDFLCKLVVQELVQFALSENKECGNVQGNLLTSMLSNQTWYPFYLNQIC